MRRFAGDLKQTLTRGFAWWTGELADVLPAGVRSRREPGRADLIVVTSRGRIVGRLPAVATATDEQSTLEDIARLAARQRPPRVVIRLPMAECLVRRIAVPKAAVRDLARIAALDLERATPFRISDVYTAVSLQAAPRGQASLVAEQIVVKRSMLAAIRDKLESAGAEVIGAGCYRSDPAEPGVENLLIGPDESQTAERRSWLPPAGWVAAAAAVLFLTALATATVRHEQALQSLREETAAVRTRVAEARKLRSGGEEALISALATWKAARPPVVELLEDLSRRLPDTAYVTQLRLADGAIELGGFGRPIRDLAPALEQSPLIESASITAPIVTDDKLQKERFDLRLRLARPPVTEASP